MGGIDQYRCMADRGTNHPAQSQDVDYRAKMSTTETDSYFLYSVYRVKSR